MRRFQTLMKVGLVAAVMLAAGVPAVARPVNEDVRVVHVQKKKTGTNFFSVWLKNWRKKLSRYAMAAN